MTWRNRLRLFLGLLVVVAVVGTATIIFAQRQGEVESSSAQIMADEYPVGTDYAGTMIEELVDVGDVVAAGDPIARIQSNELLQDLDGGATIESNAVYDVSPDGIVTLKSSVVGVVADMAVRQGGYVAAGAPVVTIQATESLYVEARFALDPVDFARVEPDARVTIELPDLGRVEGTVRQVDVVTQEGVANTTVLVDADRLRYQGPDGLIGPGTPVAATLHLRHESALSSTVQQIGAGVRGVLDTVMGLAR